MIIENNTTAPTVSIVITTWNRAHMLDRSIASVQKQTYVDWEIVISDDGSTDTTSEVVQRWQAKEPRIKYVRSSTNQGASKNYNQGFSVARGKYIAILDDDDAWSDPEKLQKQIAFLDSHPEYVGIGGGMIVVDIQGKELYRYLKPETDIAIRRRMLFSNPMANSTTVFRKSAGEEVKWYNASTEAGDRDFWLKMGLIGKLHNLPEYCAYYTMSGNNISLRDINQHLKASLRIMKQYKGKYPGYYVALMVNQLQYAYSFIPTPIRKRVHTVLARLKRAVAG